MWDWHLRGHLMHLGECVWSNQWLVPNKFICVHYKRGLSFPHHHITINDRNFCQRLEMYARLILGLHQANERWCYFVTTSLIGWAQVWNQPCSGQESTWRYRFYDIWRICHTWFSVVLILEMNVNKIQHKYDIWYQFIHICILIMIYSIHFYVCKCWRYFKVIFFQAIVLIHVFSTWPTWSTATWLTHLPLVPHICVTELGQHWFR